MPDELADPFDRNRAHPDEWGPVGFPDHPSFDEVPPHEQPAQGIQVGGSPPRRVRD
jgi:hypothetical protein